MLLLPKRRHRKRNVVGLRTDTDSGFTSVGRSGTDGMRALAFRGPEHKSEHAGRSTGASGRNGCNVTPRPVFERRAEGAALRGWLMSSDDLQASGQTVRGPRRRQGALV